MKFKKWLRKVFLGEEENDYEQYEVTADGNIVEYTFRWERLRDYMTKEEQYILTAALLDEILVGRIVKKSGNFEFWVNVGDYVGWRKIYDASSRGKIEAEISQFLDEV